MAFHDADQYVFSAAGPANRLAQHVVSLADSGRVAEKKFEDSARLFG